MEGPDAVIITGDFNLPGICWQSNTAASVFEWNFLHVCHRLNPQQLVYESTRGSSLLDLVFRVDNRFRSSTENVAPISTCDHESVLICTDLSLAKAKAYTKVIWNYNNVDNAKLHELLSSVPWDAFFIDDDIDDICSSITHFLKEVGSECIPHKEVLLGQKINLL